MTQESRLVALAQAIGADVKALQANSVGGASLPTSTSMTYDAQGRIATEVIDGVTLTYAYDAQGRISTITRPGRTETYSYDTGGRFAGMTAT